MKFDEIPKASTAIILKENKILLDLRKDNGIWEIPGGSLKKGETPEEGLKRELEEEVNIKPKKFEILGIKNGAVHFGKLGCEYYFLVKEFEGEPFPKAKREVLEVKFVNLNDLPKFLNIGWRAISGIFFLSRKFKKLNKVYEKLLPINPWPEISHSYFGYSGTSYSKKLSQNEEKEIEKIISKCEKPALEINSAQFKFVESLIEKFNEIDALEINPDSVLLLNKKFGEKINFIDGTPEVFKTNKKYKTIIAIATTEYVRSVFKFLSSVKDSLSKDGTFIFSISDKKPNNELKKYYSNLELNSVEQLLKDLGFSFEILASKNFHLFKCKI